MDDFPVGAGTSIDAFIAAAVALWFLVSAGYAATVAVSAIRTQTYAPDLGLDVRGRAASVLGWVTLVVAAALLAAGLLVAFVGSHG